ncbi:MAG: hypothetical protein JSS69_09435 [Acidobacteria bacterium]|nr:hypothetical protein [Acidobacteriota bacterium]MBS1866129.1 hypothetical protein [Acidobacteriota bacterium]
MRERKLIAATLVAIALASGIYFAHAQWFGGNGNSRESLLRALPSDSSAVIYLDFEELRQTAIPRNLANWKAGANVDAEYKQFVGETGFDYERDLDRVAIAVQNSGAENHYFALADGKFDRKKIEAYLRKNGNNETRNGRQIFHLTPGIQGRAVSAAFLSNKRIAFGDAADLNAEIEAGRRDAGHAEWTERFERLAGSPMFALIRQDAAIGALLDTRAPGGIRSPQLVQLLNQLLWISIAGKPQGAGFQTVLEGECPNEATMRQLADFLNGITLMAQSGLNDPALRQKMDPAEREAYVQLFNSIEVTKLDRGTGKSVRLALLLTPETWSKVASSTVLTSPKMEPKEMQEESNLKSSPKNKKAGTKVPAKHQ